MTPLLAIILLVFSIGFLMAMGLEKLWLVIGFFISLIAYLHFLEVFKALINYERLVLIYSLRTCYRLCNLSCR